MLSTHATSPTFTTTALGYFEDHQIEPAVATALGVKSSGMELAYPYKDRDGETFYRRRDMVGGKTLQPLGVNVEPWTPVDDDGVIFVCEGESDLMAVTSILFDVIEDDLAEDGEPGRFLIRKRDLPPPIAELRPVALPGAGSCHRKIADLAEKLVADVWICLDADKAGRDGAAKLKAKIDIKKHISVGILELPDGQDLADFLAAADDPVEALANLVAEAEAVDDSTPQGDSATVQPPVDRQAEWAKCDESAGRIRAGPRCDEAGPALRRSALMPRTVPAATRRSAQASCLLPRTCRPPSGRRVGRSARGAG